MTLHDTSSAFAAKSSSNPLIAGARVAGTDVYNSTGDHLGEIYDVMLDKQTGKVAYAIMSFGGFLGLGEKYHPIPWSVLDFDSERGGYVVPLTKDKLGVWRGTARKGGATVHVGLDFKGNVAADGTAAQ